MAAKKALQQMASHFDQEGISFWIKRPFHTFECAEKWGNEFQIKDQLEQNSSNDCRFKKTDHYKIYYDSTFAIAFWGTSDIVKKDLFSYVEEQRPLFDTLVELFFLKKQEKSYQLLVSVAHTIASSINKKNFLDVVINATISALPAADKGFLFLYDEVSNKLLVQSAIGFKKEGYLKTQLDPGEGITGKVFQSGQPMLINGEKKIKEAMSDMSEDNIHHYLVAAKNSFPDSVISAPLLYQDKIIGVLMIDSFKKGAYFVEEDLQVLHALAAHVAVAISHAKLFKMEKSQRKELQQAHEALQKEHQRLQQTTDLHYRLSSIATRGKGLPAIIHAMYETVRVPVALYDVFLKPIAVVGHETTIQLPKDFLKLPEVKKAVETKKWQSLSLNEQNDLIILPVFGTDHLLGFLCTVVTKQEVAEGTIFLLEYGATVLTLEWTKIEAVEETRNRLREELFDEILFGDINVQLIKQAQSLGFDPELNYSVVVIKERLHQNKADQFIVTEHEQVVAKINRFIETRETDCFVIQKNKEIVIILSLPVTNGLFERTTCKDQLEKLLQPFRNCFYIGVGRMRKGLIYLSQSYKEAKQCIELLQRTKSEQFLLDYSEVGVYRFFLKHEKEELLSFVSDHLGPILDYDRRKQGDLLKTLLLYVKYDKEVKRISTELNIHYNTLYYRITKIQEMTGLSLQHPDDWFNIQLSCQIYEFLDGEKLHFLKQNIPGP